MTPDESALLARVDERVANLTKAFDEFKVTVVTQEEFRPVKRLVFGAVGLILLGFVSTLGVIVYGA